MKLKKSLLGFFISAAIISAAFAIRGLFPFGSESVSWCDMNQQVIPLFCNLKDILDGKYGLFLNMKNAGGMNFYGVFFFFLSSPFSFAVKFVNKADIPFFMNVLLMIKLALSAATACFALEKIFPKLSSGLNVTLGIAYALCGYGMLFYQNIMWLDMMYLFPITALGCYRLIKDGKPVLLTVCLVLSVIFNFYLSFMVYLAVVFFFFIYTAVFRVRPSRLFPKLAASGILSLIIGGAVLVPCFIQYTSSGRRTDIVAGLKESSFFTHTDTTSAILFLSGVIFAGLLLLLPKLSASDKTAKLLLAFFVMMCVPLAAEPVNLMWHTGSYMSFPARYGYITVFAGILLTANELQKLEFSAKAKPVTAAGLTFAGFVTSVFVIIYALTNTNVLAAYPRTLWGNRESMRASLILLIAVTVTLWLIFYFSKRLTKPFFTLLVFTVVVCEGISSCCIYMGTAGTQLDVADYSEYVALESKLSDETVYRVNTSRKLTDANMTGAAGFNSIAHYTSLNELSNMKAAKDLGYSGYWMETGNWCGNIMSDALLSVSHTVTKSGDDYVVQKNPYFMKPGIKTAGNIPKFNEKSDRITEISKLFCAVTGSKNPVTKYEPDIIDNCGYTKTDGGNYLFDYFYSGGTIVYNIRVNGEQELYFDCYNGFSNALTEPVNESFSVTVNGRFVADAYPAQSHNGILHLGKFSDEEVTVTLGVLQDVECYSFGVFGVDTAVVADAAAKVTTLDIKETKNGFTGKCTEAGRYFLSVPDNKGFSVKLNGKKITPEKVLDNYMLLTLPETGTLKISYIPAGFIAGLIISIAGILLAVLLLIRSKRSRENEHINYICYGAFIGVGTLATCAVYVIPTVLNLWNDIFPK